MVLRSFRAVVGTRLTFGNNRFSVACGFLRAYELPFITLPKDSACGKRQIPAEAGIADILKLYMLP